MRIEQDLKLGFDDVLIRPKRSSLKSRKQVCLEKRYSFKHSSIEWEGIPIMVSNMYSTGTFNMAVECSKYNIITCIHKYYTVHDWEYFFSSYTGSMTHFAVSIGMKNEDVYKLQHILSRKPEISFICIDIANGYCDSFVNFVTSIRRLFPNKIIIAGNVVTPEMTEELLLAGADIVKIGIGPGSVCTTRLKTGVGYPQLSAIIECADAAHGINGHIIADGGCTCPGDFSKAYGGGADFVMSGGMFAGHDESSGKIVEKNGNQVKLFYGMSSEFAMERHGSGKQKYRTSEGKVVYSPYKGPVEQTLQDILGGLRSTCTYVGASSLKELPKRTTFVRTNKQVNTTFSQ